MPNKPDLDIITSPAAKRMLGSVTPGFYDRSHTALWIFEAIGREYDGMETWARTLRDEISPKTCTWSMPIWEQVYGYEPDERLPMAYRRARLLSHKMQVPPINPAHIEAVLSALTGCPVHVTENVAPGTFRVDVDESGVMLADYNLMYKTLRKIKPSHLSFEARSAVTAAFTATDCYAGAIGESLNEFFIGDEAHIGTAGTGYSAGAAHETIKEAHAE